MNKKLLFIFIFILNPFVWWNLLNPTNLLVELSKINLYVKSQPELYFSHEKLSKINDMRWYSLNPQIGRLFFNKASIIPNDFFYGLKTISPHFLFNPLLVPNCLSIFLLPFSICGICKLIKSKQYKPLFGFLSTSLIPVITGQTSLYYLIPSTIFYIYFGWISIHQFKFKKQVHILLIFLIYNLFVFLKLSPL
jgi:hypothetical protein